MSMLTAFRHLGSACAVFFGPRGAVAAHARQRGRSRQALYREADHALAAVEGAAAQQRLAALRQQLADTQDRLRQLQQRLAGSVEVTPDKQAEFAATAQAQGVSLAQAHALLAVLLGPATPSRAALGRLARDAGRAAGPILEVLDEHSRGRARQVAADEIFSGRKPILMTLEQDSLCWLGGRLADNRDGDSWAQELAPLTAAEQVTSDGGQGLRAGLAQVNRQRRRAGLPAVANQRDHFHALHRARRAVRTARQQAARALGPAEKAQKAYDRDGAGGVPRTGAQGRALNEAWSKAERAFDCWAAQEQAFERLRRGLRLFTPQGELNTRARAARGLLLVSGLVLALAGEAGARAQALVGEVLRGAWRASSLVEGLNSVLRMQQRRQQRLTQELLDLKRLYWNMHVFGAGKRKGSSPYGRLGVALPKGGWWQLLQGTSPQTGCSAHRCNLWSWFSSVRILSPQRLTCLTPI
jgi:hypothetical protein